MLRVYTASKLEEAEMWLEIQKTHPGVFFHARWLKHTQIGTQDKAKRAQEFWIQDEEDVVGSDVVLVFARDGQVMKGALVEAGMAIAMGIPVIVVGDHPAYSTWVYHPGVMRVATLDEALGKIEHLYLGWKKKIRAHDSLPF